MDVDKISFNGTVLDILEDISKADFVAIDFEFSGVTRNKPTSLGRNKQTLQERYEQVKIAAEKFHIPQAGLTCAFRPDSHDGTWRLRTYNLLLSPILDEDLDVERDFSFQSGAVQFLQRVDFALETSLSHGIPYLSRPEQIQAHTQAAIRADTSSIADIQLDATDVEALAFVQRVRDAAVIFNKRNHTPGAQLVIDSRAFGTDDSTTTELKHELTGFDKRLIHQLVRAEFTALRSFSRSTSIIVERSDAAREKKKRDERSRRAASRITEHVGFRWVVEALFQGGSIKDMDLRSTAVNREGAPQIYDFYDTVGRHKRIMKKLEAGRPVLVGHNLFTDLMYLYASFIGTLPDTVEGFAAEMGASFPLVVDTKYMGTHNCGSINPASSLEQLDKWLLDEMPKPKIALDEGFEKYLTQANYHEAGFDSYLTARVMIRLAARLNEGQVAAFDEDFWKEYGSQLRIFGTFEGAMKI
ncbi:ribonuclease CAF1 [Microthyrium microscopicum]|uniref:Ribonuclease CAF1 n=1 Tax=Microthyrium microscopicum TaxID=703497 RepID=A0A6A6UPQ8_9PEZI|nr:ribonuclease CAF1 [Microthyrium microscopicum]